MDIPIKLPSLGNDETEAQIEEWLVGVGDSVEEGEQVVIVNTPKVVMEIEAPASGVVKSILTKADDLIEEGATLGIIESDA